MLLFFFPPRQIQAIFPTQIQTFFTHADPVNFSQADPGKCSHSDPGNFHTQIQADQRRQGQIDYSMNRWELALGTTIMASAATFHETPWLKFTQKPLAQVHTKPLGTKPLGSQHDGVAACSGCSLPIIAGAFRCIRGPLEMPIGAAERCGRADSVEAP